MKLTRDSLVLTLGVLASVLAYLMVAPPPTEWSYAETLKFLSVLVGIGLSRLQSSPLPGGKE